jgi:hypothetical protein
LLLILPSLSNEFTQYALGDFAVRQAGKVLDKPKLEIAKYQNRSMHFVNHWDANLEFDGFKGFSQRRLAVSYFLLFLL